MAVYLVTFKLDKSDADPAPLVAAIKNLGDGWMYYIPNVVLINSSEQADTIARKLFKNITKADYLLVIRVGEDHQGWLPQDAWKWLNERRY